MTRIDGPFCTSGLARESVTRAAAWMLATAFLGCSASDPKSTGSAGETGPTNGTTAGTGGTIGGSGGSGSASGGSEPSANAGSSNAGPSGNGGSVNPPGGSGGGGATGAGGGAVSGAVMHACKVIYNGESGAGDVNLASATTWTDPNGANGTSSVTESTVNPHSGNASLKVDLKWNTGYYGGAFGFNWAGYSATKAYDIGSAQNLEFWARVETGTNDHFVLWLGDASGKASSRDMAGGYVPLVTTEWQHFAIPLSAYSGFDPSHVWELDGDTHSKPFGTAGGVIFYLDDVAFTGEACP
jgi:hypothetical protein